MKNKPVSGRGCEVAHCQYCLTSWHLNPNSWHCSGLQARSVPGSSFTQYQKMTVSKSAAEHSVGGLGVRDHPVPDPRVPPLCNEHSVNSVLRSTSWALGSKHQVAILQLLPGHTKLFKILKCLPFSFDFLFRHPAGVDGN